MPQISQQKPPGKQVTVVNGTGILASAKPVTSLVEEWIKILIYGRNRTGKTTIACQFPKPLLIVSNEPDETGGAMSVNNMKDVMIIRCAAQRLPGDKVWGTNKIIGIANELMDNNPFKTIVYDTVTSLQDIVLVELMGLSKIPEMMSWGLVPEGVYQQRAEKTREVIRKYLDLKGCHVVFLAQEKDHNPPADRGKSKLLQTMQQGSFIAPSLGGTNTQWLQDACGYVVQIYDDEVYEAQTNTVKVGSESHTETQMISTGKRQRHLRLLYHPNFAGGGRWAFDKNTPEFVTAPTPNELYKKMAKYLPSLKV